jgi:cyanophycinase-like exopeptidase
LNAGDVTARAVEYFEQGVQRPIEICSFRDAEKMSPFEEEQAFNLLREARYVFCGPGSPTYALRQWNLSLVPELLREKLRSGGCVTFASAAACTLGLVALPVYEVYKVGEPVHWEKGLDLLSEASLPVAVIPHYNNREGGTHDTRFCYMGEPRLKALEEMMPGDAFVLGVDEHTACVIDLDSDEMTVTGVGCVTIRRGGQVTTIESGSSMPLQRVRAMGGGEGLSTASHPTPTPPTPLPEESPFWDGVEVRKANFDAAIASGNLKSTIDEVLGFDDFLWSWSHESFGTDELLRARAIFREMIARLGQEALKDARDPRSLIAPYVEAMLAVRDRARGHDRFEEADVIRDALLSHGIEIHDGSEGTTWQLRVEE